MATNNTHSPKANPKESRTVLRGQQRSRRRPLYATIAEDISKFILDNELKAGHQLPAEEELARLFAVSRPTVREALRELEVSGVIIRTRGRTGTMVADPNPIVAGLTALESVEALAAQQGWLCETTDVYIEARRLTDAQARLLGVPPDSEATFLERMKLKNGEPVSIMRSWIPIHIVSPEEFRQRFETSITEFFLDDDEHHLASATAWVSATGADKEEAAALAVAPGSPLVVLKEVFFDASGRALCECHNVFVSGSIELKVNRQPRDTRARAGSKKSSIGFA